MRRGYSSTAQKNHTRPTSEPDDTVLRCGHREIGFDGNIGK